MNKEVKFELAKLLKEKGFNNIIKLLYSNTGELVKGTLPNSLTNYYSAPTIAEVVMWLYERYGIWIYSRTKPLLGIIKFEVEIEIPVKSGIWLNNDVNYYSSPIIAYEAAIEYVLKNLI